MQHPTADELARVSSAEAGQAKMLRRNLAELGRLPDSTTAEPKPLDPATRLEAGLIEKRIERNARREIRASQLEPSQIIYSTLGAFPVNDPDKAVAWNDGAHAIAIYRHRHDIHDDANPFGRQPRRASARAERAALAARRGRATAPWPSYRSQHTTYDQSRTDNRVLGLEQAGHFGASHIPWPR